MVRLANGITAAWANIAGPLISDLWFPARERTLATATAPQDEDLTMDALSTGKWLFDMFDCLGFLRPQQRERLINWVLMCFPLIYCNTSGIQLLDSSYGKRGKKPLISSTRSIDSFDCKTISCTWNKVKEHPNVWRQDLVNNYIRHVDTVFGKWMSPEKWGAQKDEELQSSVPPVFSTGFKLSWWKGLLSIFVRPSSFLEGVNFYRHLEWVLHCQPW